MINDSEHQRYWHALMPEIKAHIERVGGVFDYDGFVPCVVANRWTFQEEKRQISMQRIINFAKQDKYKEIHQYLDSIVHPSIII